MSTTVDSLENDFIPETNPWIICIGTMIATFMVILDSAIANVALPNIAGSLSHSQDEAIWILTSYLIANSIILPSCAWFSGILGRKKFFIICIIIFTIASVLCGMSNSLEMMIASRVLQGLGGGALIPISQSILLESFPKEKRGLAMSIFGIGVVLAPVIGPPLGGWLTDNYSWHWIFFINIPFGIISVLLCQMYIHDPIYAKKKEVKQIDYLGFGLLILWVVTLQVVLDKGQNADWFAAPWVCWTSAVSLISLILFIYWQLVYKNPIIDLTVFKDRNFTIGTIIYTCINVILYASLAILPLFLQTLMGYSTFISGCTIMPRGIGCILGLGVTGCISGKVDDRLIIAAGLVLLSVANFMLGNLNLQISTANIIFPNIIMGLAFALCTTPIVTISMATLKNEKMTNATGMQNLCRNIGGAVGVSLVTTLLSRFSQAHQVYMVKNLSNLNYVFQHKLAVTTHALSHYMNPVIAAQKANYVIYAEMLKQSALCAYMDFFKLYSLITILLIPGLFLLKKVKYEKKSKDLSSLH